MKALITGASSGIGRDIARELAARGYELILTARREDRLLALKEEFTVPVTIITADLSTEGGARELYSKVADENIDLLVNNAGLGVFGTFYETYLQNELELISVNIRSMHILMKLFLIEFKKKNKGCILNVASSAAFLPGPLMAAYYASKAYVLRLSQAVAEELRRDGSNVQISALCPGPVHTEFSQKADVSFQVKSLSSPYVAKYAVSKMLKGKKVIVPGFTMKCARFFERLTPDSLLVRMAWYMQKRKRGK